MPHPRDWFRHRRKSEPPHPSQTGEDPFLLDGVLELGPSVLEKGVLEKGALERRGPIPAPRERDSEALQAATLDQEAFLVRPKLVRPELVRPEPVRPEPALERLDPPLSAPRPVVRNTRDWTEARRAAFALHRIEPTRPPEEAPVAVPEPVRVDPPEGPKEESEAPSFTLAAPGLSWARGRGAKVGGPALNAALRDAFTPTRPKLDLTLFSGRHRQMQRIIAAIEEERAHIVVYGERGSGKTSLANILAGKATEAGYFVQRFACASELSFDDIFRSFLRRIPATFLSGGGEVGAGLESFVDLVPDAPLGVSDLANVFARIYDKHVILIIDEYDRVTSEDVKNKLAELIKNLSDAGTPVTLLLIGVADNVRELLGKHPSLQRALVTIPLPLMSPREIEGILITGAEKSGIAFDPKVRRTIVSFAQGLPYHAQLLGLFAARNALRRHSMTVEHEDLRYAIERACEEAEARIREAYALAVGHQESSSFVDVLYHAAICASDEFGTFTAADVAAAAKRSEDDETFSLLSLQYPLKKLTEPERGAVLRRMAGPGGLRYQFCNQMMRHYVLVRQAVQRGLI